MNHHNILPNNYFYQIFIEFKKLIEQNYLKKIQKFTSLIFVMKNMRIEIII